VFLHPGLHRRAHPLHLSICDSINGSTLETGLLMMGAGIGGCCVLDLVYALA
jgi:hypothetical protein